MRRPSLALRVWLLVLNACRSALGALHPIAAGDRHTCAIRQADGAAECWGRNDDGQATPPDADE
eukprot:gene40742-47810_t